MYKWILFANNVPECGWYESYHLSWLAESLTCFEGSEEKNQSLLSQLLAMPVGIIQVIEGKRVVKVIDSKVQKQT